MLAVHRLPLPPALLVAAISALAVAAWGVPAAAQPESVQGVVTDGDGRPVAGVEVVLREAGGGDVVERHTTDREGAFTVGPGELRPGRELALELDGFEDLVLAVGPQHLVVSRIELTMTRSVRMGAEPAAPSEPREPAERRYEPMSKQRERTIRLYNEAVKQYDDGVRKNIEEDVLEAETKLREAASLDPTFAAPHRVLARIAVKNQNWAEASRYAEDLLRIDANDIEGIRTLYLSLVVLRHHLRVGDAAVRLAEAEPSTITSIEEHARTFFGNGAYLMARELYEALAQVLEDPVTAYLNLGICCVALDDAEGARKAFESFLELAPEDHPDIPMAREQLESLP